jgi:hypothetical protein
MGERRHHRVGVQNEIPVLGPRWREDRSASPARRVSFPHATSLSGCKSRRAR